MPSIRQQRIYPVKRCARALAARRNISAAQSSIEQVTSDLAAQRGCGPAADESSLTETAYAPD